MLSSPGPPAGSIWSPVESLDLFADRRVRVAQSERSLPSGLGPPHNELERAVLIALRNGAVSSEDAATVVVVARQHGWQTPADLERALERDRSAGGAPPPSLSPGPPAAPARGASLEDIGSLDAVHFGVTCPDSLASPDMAVVDVWAFLAAQRQQILEATRGEHRGPVTLVSQGPVRVLRGTQLYARLWFDGLEVPDPLNQLLWLGEIANTTFVVKVPPRVKPGPRHGKVTILVGGMPLAHLSCVIEVGPRVRTRTTHSRTSAFDRAGRRRAFASYASPDRREVVARVQGLEKAGVDVFLDVKNLRAGERYEARLLEEITARDVFFLFWSKAARASRWVEKEWRFALAKRGLNFIDPIPLVAPEKIPPPTELADALHFRDWTLAYIASTALAPRRWWQFWRV